MPNKRKRSKRVRELGECVYRITLTLVADLNPSQLNRIEDIIRGIRGPRDSYFILDILIEDNRYDIFVRTFPEAKISGVASRIKTATTQLIKTESTKTHVEKKSEWVYFWETGNAHFEKFEGPIWGVEVIIETVGVHYMYSNNQIFKLESEEVS